MEVKEQTIGKYLGKVVLKTLSFLLAVVLVLVGVFLLALPKTASQLFSKMGIDSLASSFAVTAYNRSKDINDLGNAFEKSVIAKKHMRVIECGELLLESSDFEDYCAFRDVNFAFSNYKNFVYGNLAISFAENGEKEIASEYALTNVEGKYDKNSAVSYLVYHLIDKNADEANSKEIANYLIERLDEVYRANTDKAYDLVAMSADAYVLAEHFSVGDVAEWEKRYNGI